MTAATSAAAKLPREPPLTNGDVGTMENYWTVVGRLSRVETHLAILHMQTHKRTYTNTHKHTQSATCSRSPINEHKKHTAFPPQMKKIDV